MGVEEPDAAALLAQPVGAAATSDLGISEDVLYRSLLEAVPDVTVFAFGGDLRYRLVSGGAFLRLGWTSGEIVGRRPSEIMPADEGHELEEHMRAALNGEVREHEHPGIRDKGVEWVSTIAPVRAPDGRVVAGMIVSRDVAPMRRAERARLESQQAELLAVRARLLSEVSAAVAGAGDTSGALQAFVDALVPAVADFAAFYVADGPTGLVDDAEPVPPLVMSFGAEVAAVGPPPPPARRDEPSPWQQMLQAGTPVIIPIDSSTLDAVAPDPAAAAWLHATASNSLAVMPMVVAGQLTGALLVMAAGQRAAYTEADLPFLTDVAARAGVALAQQQTQQRQRDIAGQLQRALLPPEPSTIPGLELAARYVAGAPGVDVGGDWWHTQELGDGRVALGIGDVSGRGVTAAVVMGQARAAMGAAGHAQLAPAHVLRLLDAQLEAVMMPDAVTEPAPPRFATACYGIVEPAHGIIRVSNAGHPPLLRRDAGGHVDIVEVTPGAPLGLLAGGFIEVEVPFVHGDTVALFTDGLVESRALDIENGLAALMDALGRFGGHPDLNIVIKQVLDAMSTHAGHGDDDMALLLARRQ